MCMSAEWGRPMATCPRLFHLTVTLNRTKWILKGNELMFAVDWKVKISLTCDCTAATEPVEMFQVDPPSGYSLWWGLILSLSEIRMSTLAPGANKGGLSQQSVWYGVNDKHRRYRDTDKLKKSAYNPRKSRSIEWFYQTCSVERFPRQQASPSNLNSWPSVTTWHCCKTATIPAPLKKPT